VEIVQGAIGTKNGEFVNTDRRGPPGACTRFSGTARTAGQSPLQDRDGLEPHVASYEVLLIFEDLGDVAVRRRRLLYEVTCEMLGKRIGS
jgi:hypothetical protein